MSINLELTVNESGWTGGGLKSDDDASESLTMSGLQSHNVPNGDDTCAVHNHHNCSGNDTERCAGGRDDDDSALLSQGSLSESVSGLLTTHRDNIKVNSEATNHSNNKMENRLDDTDNDIRKERPDLKRKDFLNLSDSSKDKDNSERTSEKPNFFQPSNDWRRVPQKPGVILLGRGNSFSLGRSEVILLHNQRPKSKSTKERKCKNHGIDCTLEENLETIDERRVSLNSEVPELNMKSSSNEVVVCDEYQAVPSPSPPPVSNGFYHPDSSEDISNNDESRYSSVVELVPSFDDDLQSLWFKAESLMAEKNGRVRRILEEFGIGEPGGGGGEEDENYGEDEEVEERKKEEEEVWQLIQER